MHRNPALFLRKSLLILVGSAFLLHARPILAEPCPCPEPSSAPACTEYVPRRGIGSAYSSYDSIAMSMMLWGVGLAIGIAGLSVWLNEGETAH